MTTLVGRYGILVGSPVRDGILVGSPVPWIRAALLQQCTVRAGTECFDLRTRPGYEFARSPTD
jgi:hypothetical protein